MGARLRSWWQQIKQHRVAIGVVGIILVAVITLIIAGYWFDWTGFNGYNKVSTVHTISGPSAGTVTKTEEYQPGKALWDWLQLLIIPAVLAIGGYVFNLTVSRNERKAASDRDRTEREIAKDNQQEATLQEYINKMSELLLHENLREPKPEKDEIRKIGRVRTLTVLSRLDKVRKKSVLQFLYESGLIDKHRSNIALVGANLSIADLSGANLSIADLSEADLSFANLSGANLSGADLNGATVAPGQLDQAQSLKDATMPDGSKHP